MHAPMGTDIANLNGQLFEPEIKDEVFENLRLDIESAIKQYLSYIRVINIRMITQDEEPELGNNKIRISMDYTITDQSAIVDTINIGVNNPTS